VCNVFGDKGLEAVETGRRGRSGPGLVVGLDPSSTVVGYGVLDMAGRFMEAGLLLPERRGAPSWRRVADLADEVERLLERLRPAVVLVEWSKGKVNVRRHGGRGAGLAVYGAGIGAVGRQCQLWARGRPQVQLEAVLENDWTRGVPKKDRQLAVASIYPQYGAQLGDDPGGDMADGLGLAAWWLRQRAGKELWT